MSCGKNFLFLENIYFFGINMLTHSDLYDKIQKKVASLVQFLRFRLSDMPKNHKILNSIFSSEESVP